MAKNTAYFDSVDLKVNFPQMEEKLLKEWYENGIVTKYLHKNDNSKKIFSFMDGPITANNPMGVHHAWGRTYKDIWQRFNNMRGFRQRFQNGFDAQGLWVEVEVEKELGFTSKKHIEEYGIDKFVQKCRERVIKYSEIQTEQSKRLGYFMDWENSYYTMSEDNNYMIWHFLKVCHDNGWIYKGHDSVPWCPRCETAISQHEMLTEDYKEVTHTSVYMRFPIEGKKSEYLLVWTTTPWTIPANIAVAVDSEMEYSLIDSGDGNLYWVSAGSAERVFGKGNYKVEKKVDGKKLLGMKYSSAFDNLPAVKTVSKDSPENFHIVIPTDTRIMPISETEGTGLVHTAVSAGVEDFQLGKKLGLPMIPVINDRAEYVDGLEFLSGQNAKKHPEIVLDYMNEKGFVYKTEEYSHRYPACWRCRTELVWKVTDEWYIAMDRQPKGSGIDDKNKNTLRERMVDVAKTINWIPSFGLERELDWLKNMHDWLISKKNRYWGLALPIWECEECGWFDIIGSKEDLEKRAVSGWEKFKGKSPHKPQIDEVKIKCEKCGKVATRIEPVGNPWLDAGIVPYSTVSENNKAATLNPTDTKPLYKYDKEDWNKWVPAGFITESFPGQFKNWFYSLIAMSSALENKKPFKTVLGFATLVAEDGRPMHKSWGNMIEFMEGAGKIGVDVMRLMYARQNPTENMLFGYKIADEIRRRFHLKLWNVYNYFVTYATIDGWIPKSSNPLLPESKNILDIWILSRLNNTILTATKSLEKYNATSATLAIEEFVDDLSNWYVRRSRDRTGPTAEDEKDRSLFYETIYYVLVYLMKVLSPMAPFMTDMIYKNLTKEESVHLTDWPVKTEVIDENLELEMINIRLIVEKIHAVRKDKQIPVRQPLQKVEVAASFKISEEKLIQLIKDEVNVKEVEFKKGSELTIKLDTNITEELAQEAKVRDLIRNIQQVRKEMGVSLKDRVDVTAPWIPENEEFIEKVRKTTLTETLHQGEFKVEKI